MSQPPRKDPDRHYNFRSMNVFFAWSAIALLAVTLWMVVADYAKPWKRFQAEFRDLERQELLAEAQAERERLNQNEIQQIEQEIAVETQKLDKHRAEIAELESQVVALGKSVYKADAENRTTKSLLDTARYQYDVAAQTGDSSAVEEAEAEVERLRNRWVEERRTLEGLTQQRAGVQEDLDGRRQGLGNAERRQAALVQGLDSLSQRVAGLGKTIDYYLLNAPLMDFVEPSLRIEQVMLPGLFQDINFTQVDRVDRCVTCHVASNRVGFDGEKWEAPFRSHPRLDLFVGAGSPHPYSKFGCSVCHGGLDRATDFARAGHSPSDEVERARWEADLGWEEQPYLETPIFPAEISEAGCVTCHAADVWTPSSQQQDVGRELITRMGCFGCHKIDYPAFSDLPRPGPSLRKVAGKTNPGWAYKWVEAPREFHPTTWMPHFFFQENIKGEENLDRQRAEISAIVAYLWDQSEKPEYPTPPAGNSERGKQLFETVGCTGCHVLDGDAKRAEYFPDINRLHGPNLIRTGSKVSPGWLYAWVRDPKKYFPETRMPNLRLTDQEAADVVAFLMGSRDPDFENLELPQAPATARDNLALGYLRTAHTIEQSAAKLEAMGSHERDLLVGKQSIAKYGCFGCHDIAGFEDTKPIGVELTQEGSKPIHQFDFGHIHDVPHTRQDWIRRKLLEPRSWDHGKEMVKNYEELLVMPDFGMSEEEAQAVLTNVMGFTQASAVASRRAGTSARSSAIAAGRRLVSSYNCQACHLVEGKGRAIKTSIEDSGLLPPDLAAEGARVQADWLFDYLHNPGSVTMRPWLGVRMPTFGFSDDQINTVISYFTSRDERVPFQSAPERPEKRELAVGAVAFEMFQCAKCHPSGPQTATSGGLGTADLAPSLLLASHRLRSDWVPSWIKDPQSWITGTNMPANFPKSAEGTYQSPLGNAIDAPMFSAQKRRLLVEFESEAELKQHLLDADYVTEAIRDHIWWGLGR